MDHMGFSGLFEHVLMYVGVCVRVYFPPWGFNDVRGEYLKAIHFYRRQMHQTIQRTRKKGNSEADIHRAIMSVI